MTVGHPEQSQAEIVGSGNANQFNDPRTGSNPGGTSQGIGFGPYTLAPGDSIRIVLAEGAAGLSREMCYQVGQNWKNDIHQESRETVENLQDSIAPADISDRATQESEKTLELKSRDRHRKLISKIDAALNRIENGSYGYCEVTGEPINIERLDARPVTTLSIEAQEMHERNEKLHSDD